MKILELPGSHYFLFAVALLGHCGAWLLCRSIHIYPACIVYVGALYLMSSSLNTFVVFALSDLHFAKPGKSRTKAFYFIFPVLSAIVCVLVATLLRAEIDSPTP